MSEERDREVDAAWRAASSEEPPPQLDAAVRAEARRAVGAGPGESRRRRYRQWRYPFAAAATVALLAFGIAQMTPPDQVSPGIVSDQPAAPRERAPEPQAPAPPPTQLAENAPAAPQPQAAIDAQARKELRRKDASADERFAAAPSQEEARSRRQAPSPPETPSVDATAKLTQSPPASQASPSPAPSVAANAPKSEPFPATSAAGASGTAPPQSAPSQSAPSPAAAPPAARRDAYTEAPKREQAGPATAVGAVKRRSAEAPLMQATASDFDERRAKQAGAESVEAWIARIRELKASGQVDAAAKELEKFRTTYGERADALLPQDLRAGAPSRP
jgi:hypothetical protein